MDNKKYLEKTLEVKIDRPFGSKHPKHGFIYPVNYGYVPNTISGDGEELDCYVLGVFEPLETFRGKYKSTSLSLWGKEEFLPWDIKRINYERQCWIFEYRWKLKISTHKKWHKDN